MSDKDLLQGSWEVVGFFRAGVPDPDEIGDGCWFEGDTILKGNEDAAWAHPFRLGEFHGLRTIEIWSDQPAWHYRQIAAYHIRGEPPYSIAEQTNPPPAPAGG